MSASPLPPAGPPPHVACLGECMIELRTQADGSLVRGFGGDTLNTAVYLARLGTRVDYVTALGDDSFSAEMIRAWAAEGVGTGLVPRLPGRLPGLYMIETDAAGERRFHYWRDSAPVRQLLDQPDWPDREAALLGADVLYLSGITLSLFRGADLPRLLAVMERFAAAGRSVVFDTNFRRLGWPDRAEAARIFDAAIGLSSLVLAGVEDLAQIEGVAPDEAAADRFAAQLASRAPEAVLKLVRPGCRVLAAGGDETVPALTVDRVVDTTAAGDSFAAGYLAARLAGAAPVDAARAGHRLAAEVVRHPGALIPRAAMPGPA